VLLNPTTMIMQTTTELSAEAATLKKICDGMAKSVATSIKEMVGDPTSGQVTEMGADGTPTKRIDQIAESMAFEFLERSGIEFTILSEEMGKKVVGENPKYFIYLDPLDGTFNAINGIPFYAISVYISNQSCNFGYVFDLAHEIKYYAEEGRGAWTEVGGEGMPRRLKVSTTKNLVNFSITAYTARPKTRRINNVADVVRRARTMGSTSLELCLVACGKMDAFVDLRHGLRIVDVAAGNLIAKEAGGLVTDGRGRKVKMDGVMWQKNDLIVSNGEAHQALLKLAGGGGD